MKRKDPQPSQAPTRRERPAPPAPGRGSAALVAAASLATAADWLACAETLYAQEQVALGQVATNAHDEALYLLLHALGLPLTSEPSVLDRLLTPAQKQAVEDMFRRRVLDRIPAAYLTHEAWLGEHRFYVDERVIIPRSYFLELIPGQISRLLPAGKIVRRAIDVCTGSGCLAILLAHHFPEAHVDACDLSPDALEVAKINVREHGLDQRITLLASDVLGVVPPALYDVMVSNPPYEPSARVERQAPEFAAEPRMAHDGGRDGMRIIRTLLREAPTRLSDEGILLIEVGGLRPAIQREFAALKPQWLRTQDGSNCVVLFRAAALKAATG